MDFPGGSILEIKKRFSSTQKLFPDREKNACLKTSSNIFSEDPFLLLSLSKNLEVFVPFLFLPRTFLRVQNIGFKNA